MKDLVINFEIYEKESGFKEQALITFSRERLNETLNNKLAMA